MCASSACHWGLDHSSHRLLLAACCFCCLLPACSLPQGQRCKGAGQLLRLSPRGFRCSWRRQLHAVRKWHDHSCKGGVQ